MRRLAAVVAVALAGFVAALATFDQPPLCAADAPADPAYRAEFVPAGDAGGTVVVVTRDGRPVSGARVCLRGVGAEGGEGVEARETAPGRYGLPGSWGPDDRWRGRVLVSEGGTAPPVAVPVGVDRER